MSVLKWWLRRYRELLGVWQRFGTKWPILYRIVAIPHLGSDSL
jgi:hypothetical protein